MRSRSKNFVTSRVSYFKYSGNCNVFHDYKKRVLGLGRSIALMPKKCLEQAKANT